MSVPPEEEMIVRLFFVCACSISLICMPFNLLLSRSFYSPPTFPVTPAAKFGLEKICL